MAATPMEPFVYAVENGFDAFEWFPDKKETGAGWDASDIDDAMRRYIRETARAHDIVLTVHAPWWVNPMMRGAETIFSEQINFAESIGAILLNVHLDTSKGLQAYIQALVPLVKQCRQADLKLAIENTPLTGPEDFNRLFVLLQDRKDITTEHVGMCFDLGHANLCSGLIAWTPGCVLTIFICMKITVTLTVICRSLRGRPAGMRQVSWPWLTS
jgi:sugar phosphate isomerase/epimerase